MRDFDRVLRVLDAKGWSYFDNGKPFNLNIIGIRSESRGSGKFDDTMMLSYRNKAGARIVRWFPFTADPGTHWLLRPMVSSGTLIMLPDQYRSSYAIGIHGRSWASGGYPALEQLKDMVYVRDNNRDDVLDIPNSGIHCDIVRECYRAGLNVVRGNFKTNIHRAHSSLVSELIGRHSAGCQVLKNAEDFNDLMRAARLAVDSGFRNVFTYTLIHEKWLSQV